MKSKRINRTIVFTIVIAGALSCGIPKASSLKENKDVPAYYLSASDTISVARLNWKEYFSDPDLVALIDTALQNNQELNIMLQEIEISKNEIRAKKGEYLPTINVGASGGVEKSGRFTRNGSVEHNLEIDDGKPFPEPLPDIMLGVGASWEIDVWRKLRNGKDAANRRYLASVEGKNFMVTNLVAEIAESYYELMALDNMLENIDTNIVIQSNALSVAKQQKDAAKVTQLAVNRFEAQLLNTKNQQFEVKQAIIETENRINFLIGRFPQRVKRNSRLFVDLTLDSIEVGVPSQLMANRPDILRAEQNLAASRLDVKIARANFYPSFRITAGLGFNAFNPAFIVSPESMIYSLAGDLVAPLVNRNGIQAVYASSNAKQVQAVYSYQQTILTAYVDVVNQLSRLNNYSQSYSTKKQEVDILMQSVVIANSLFNSARADYSEVLLTQREAMDSKTELIEIKLKQLSAKVNIYRALGGGWK